MEKPGINVSIPGHGDLNLKYMVSDYTGTLSYRGRLAPGVPKGLRELAEFLDIHILSADTRETAGEQLAGLPVQLHVLTGTNQDVQKRDFAARFDLRKVAAFGNGANDRLLLKAVKQAGGLAVSVDNGEGCAFDAQVNAHIHIVGGEHALDLLLDSDFVKATLRF